MGKEISFTLSRNEVGQLLDGLTIRAESWENTAAFLRSVSTPEGDLFIIEDCSEPSEAEEIAHYYRAIIEKIERQMEP